MSSPRLRVAVIGTGMIASAHVRAARDAHAEVLGVLGSTPQKSDSASESWGVGRGYADLESLLADLPDVVHVCTPNDTHVAYGRALAQAGINMVVEKPIATSLQDAEQLAEEVRRADVVATVPFVYRYHPMVREIRARLRAGDLGDPLLVHGSYLQDWLLSPDASTWRVDEARNGRSRAFADIGSHWADLAEFVTGETFVESNSAFTIAYPDRPVSAGTSFGVRSRDERRASVSTEDVAVVTFRTARGIVANVVVSQVSAGRKNRLWLEVDGSRGSAVFDQEQPEVAWFGGESGAAVIRRGEGAASPDQARMNRIPAGHPQGWPDALSSFCSDTYAAVRGDWREGVPTIEDGLRSVRVIDSVLRSASSRVWEAIDPGVGSPSDRADARSSARPVTPCGPVPAR